MIFETRLSADKSMANLGSRRTRASVSSDLVIPPSCRHLLASLEVVACHPCPCPCPFPEKVFFFCPGEEVHNHTDGQAVDDVGVQVRPCSIQGELDEARRPDNVERLAVEDTQAVVHRNPVEACAWAEPLEACHADAEVGRPGVASDIQDDGPAVGVLGKADEPVA